MFVLGFHRMMHDPQQAVRQQIQFRDCSLFIKYPIVWHKQQNEVEVTRTRFCSSLFPKVNDGKCPTYHARTINPS